MEANRTPANVKIKNKEAVDKLRRLLNTNFKESDFKIEITYNDSIKNRNKDGQQAIY